MKAVNAVELLVLQGVEDVETRHPKGHGEKEPHGRTVERRRGRHPSAQGSESVRCPEDEMAPGSEALRERIEKEDPRRERKEEEGGGVEHGRCQDEDDKGDDRVRPRLPDADEAAGERTPARPRVGGVDVAVDDPVERHRQRARRDHGHGRPRPHPERGPRPRT